MTVVFQIPELETERLRLRAPHLDDWPAMCEFFASDRAKFVGGPMTAEQTWRGLATETGHWALRGYGRWALEEKATGKYHRQLRLCGSLTGSRRWSLAGT